MACQRVLLKIFKISNLTTHVTGMLVNSADNRRRKDWCITNRIKLGEQGTLQGEQ